MNKEKLTEKILRDFKDEFHQQYDVEGNSIFYGEAEDFVELIMHEIEENVK